MFFHARLKQVVLSTAACILLFISEVQTEPGVVVCKFVILLIALIYRLKPSKKKIDSQRGFTAFSSAATQQKNCSRNMALKRIVVGFWGDFSRHQDTKRGIHRVELLKSRRFRVVFSLFELILDLLVNAQQIPPDRKCFHLDSAANKFQVYNKTEYSVFAILRKNESGLVFLIASVLPTC